MFMPLILSLVIWLTTTNSAPYASRQGKQAFIFHCIVEAIQLIMVVGVLLLGFLVFGLSFSSLAANPYGANSFLSNFLGVSYVIIGCSLLINLSAIVIGAIAAVQAFQGRPYHYPLLGRF